MFYQILSTYVYLICQNIHSLLFMCIVCNDDLLQKNLLIEIDTVSETETEKEIYGFFQKIIIYIQYNCTIIVLFYYCTTIFSFIYFSTNVNK